MKNIDPLPNMDNSIEQSFEFPLLKVELSVAFILFLMSFVCLHT